MERMLWKPWTAASRRTQLAATPEKITTFRQGVKWLRPELVGQRVELFDEAAKTVFATAEVISVKAAKFRDLDDIDHDRQSGDMTPENRLKVMQSVYGTDYSTDTLTTVVTLGNIEEGAEVPQFRPGDVVRIQRAAKSHERGWGNSWVVDMDDQVGHLGIVTYVDRFRHDVTLDMGDDHNYGYPAFVLKLVQRQK